MIKIFINDVDVTDKVLQKNFRVIRKIGDRRASLALDVPLELVPLIKPSNDLKITYTDAEYVEKTIFGGIVYTLRYNKLTDAKVRLNLECEGYTIIPSRRTITDILDLEPTDPSEEGYADMNSAGYVAAQYALDYLTEEGVNVGWVEPGARMAEGDIEYFDVENLKEIFDKLADMGGDNWDIDENKKFQFVPMLYSKDYIGEEHEALHIKSGNAFFNVDVETTVENFKNKVFVIGSAEWEDEDVPEENLDLDGRLKVWVQNDNSIQYMQNLNGDSGVWGYVIRNEDIKTLDDAYAKANAELEKYSQLPVNLRVQTEIDIFKPSDKVLVHLPEFDLVDRVMTIEEVEIMPRGESVVYTLHCVNAERVVKREDFVEFMDKLVKEAKNKYKPKIARAFKPPLQGLELWVDLQKEGSVILGEGNKIQSILDANTETDALIQINPENQPTFVTQGGHSWVSFNSDPYPFTRPQRGDFLNMQKPTLIGTAFVVYKDRTLTGTYASGYSCPVGANVQGSPAGDTLVSNADYSVSVNGIDVDRAGQKRIRDTKTLLMIKDIDGSLQARNQLLYFGMNRSQDSEFNRYFTGEIAEIFVYNRVLEEQEISSITNYLKRKYNIK